MIGLVPNRLALCFHAFARTEHDHRAIEDSQAALDFGREIDVSGRVEQVDIGVAPAEGKGSAFMPAYPFGGNIDLREMEAGTTLFLPVQVDGALLSMGDLHAAMGIAEPTWVSLEAAGSATLRISLEKNKALKFPRLRVDSSTYCLGMADTLEKAYQIALDD